MRAISCLVLALLSICSLSGQSDFCDTATDISSLFGADIGVTMMSDVYDMLNSSSDDSDPTFGWECFADQALFGEGAGVIDRTNWFTFVGDGNAYLLKGTNCGGAADPYLGLLQMALYSGGCDALTPVNCRNHITGDAEFIFTAEENVEYKMMLDRHWLAAGEYCLEITQYEIDEDQGCGQHGEYAFETVMCFGDPIDTEILSDPVIPVTGGMDGFFWILNTAPVDSDWSNPFDNNFQAWFGFEEVVYVAFLYNDGDPVPHGTYYLTPVIYSDMQAASNGWPDFVSGCVKYGESIEIQMLGEETFSASLDNDATTQTISVESEGSGSYSYEWSDGSTASTFNYTESGTYELELTDNSGCFDPISLSLDVVYSGIEDIGNLDIKIFPNPTSDVLTIAVPEGVASDIKFEILDMTGRVRISMSQETGNGLHKLDVSTLEQGEYVLLLSERGEYFAKTTVQVY